MNYRILFCFFLLVFTPPVTAQDANDELIEMVLELVLDEDKDIRGLAFEQIRNEVKGASATKRIAEELPKLKASAQVGLLAALADRGDPAAIPSTKALIGSRDVSVSVAAIRALGRLGNQSNVPDFVPLIVAADKTKAEAARVGLSQLSGDGVSKEIVGQIEKASGDTRVVLTEVLTSRRAMDTIPDLLQWAQGDDASLRAAAMRSLGELAGPEHVAEMVQAVLKAKKGNERNAAEKCVMFVCQGIEDPDKRALPILEAMAKLNVAERTAMIPTLGRVGGEAAWEQVKKAIASRDAAVHMAGIRGISNWPNASVADDLIRIAKTDRHPDHQRIARMSLLRIAPLPDGRSDLEKLALLKTSMGLSANDKEKNYGIKRAAAIRLIETLRYILPYLKQPAYRKQASQTIVELAHDRGLRDTNKEEFHAALDQVLGMTDDPVLIDRANRYKLGQTWVRPK